MTRWPHTGVVLAGGTSRRMGEPKHALRLPSGITMAEHVAAVLGELCAAVIVSGPGDVLPDLPHVDDHRVETGPLAGLEAVLLSDRDEQYLFCPCDMPLVDARTLALLVESAHGAVCAFWIDGERSPRPLPLRISAATRADVQAMLEAGALSVGELLGRVDTRFVELAREPAELVNVNTPEDLRRALV